MAESTTYGGQAVQTTNPDGSTSWNSPVATPPATKPAAIVTSSASKTNYNSNVNTLNTANTNLQTVKQGQTATGIAASLGLTPEKFLELNPQFGAKGNKGDYKGLSGVIQPGMTYKIAPDGTPTVVPDTTKVEKGTTTNPDGSSSSVGGDGSTTYTTANGNAYTVPKGGDPAVYKLLNDNIEAMSKSATDAKLAMDAAAATLNDDPAAQAAAENIKRQFDVLIQQMKDKNNILIGSYGKNSARSGMLQYANEMDTDFKSMEFDKATARVTDLLQKELDAINKSNAAYKSGNVKALDAATKEYQKTLEDKQKAIMDLNKSINDAVKLGNDEAKAAAAQAKQQITDDIRVSTALGSNIADAILKTGIKDEAKIDEYIANMAEEAGIENVEILKSAVIKAQQALKKTNLQNESLQLTVNKKKNPPKNTNKAYGNFSKAPTAAVVTKVNSYLTSIGATAADIKKVNGDEVSFYKVYNAIP